MELSSVGKLPLTYPEVGATGEALPGGYHHLNASARIGAGRPRFERAADTVMHWGMQRGAGLGVQASAEKAAVGVVVVVRIGFLRAPCRVVYVVGEPDRRGFAYGTLPGHPESGEELFTVRYDPAGRGVYAEVRAFSRPATWWSRLGLPITRLAQWIVARRYLRGI